MTKENFAYLLGGLAFGVLIGVGLFRAVGTEPELDLRGAAQERQSPAGPMAPTQVGPGSQAPMMAEIRALQQRARENPEDDEAIVRLANLYHEVSMWDQAIAFYAQALQLRQDDPDLLTDMGVCFRAKSEFDRALQLFDRAHQSDPSHWQSLFNSAVVAGFDLGRFDLAREALHAMDALAPTDGGPDPTRIAELRSALEQAEERLARQPGSS